MLISDNVLALVPQADMVYVLNNWADENIDIQYGENFESVGGFELLVILNLQGWFCSFGLDRKSVV